MISQPERSQEFETQVEFPMHLYSIASLKLLICENTSEEFIKVYVRVGLKLPVLNTHHTQVK